LGRKLIGKIFLFSFFAVAAPAFQVLYSLSGVVEDETKQAVAGVEVTLHYGKTVQRTTTNDLGQFRFDSVPQVVFSSILISPDSFGLAATQ
jgi:hypothetical protein